MTYGHLQADCLYTGISSGPNARYRVWEKLYLYLFILDRHACVRRGEVVSIDMSEFPVEVICAVLTFVYTSEIEVSDDVVGPMMKCADELGICAIVEMCIDYLSNVTVDTAIMFYSIAENYDLCDIKDCIYNFIINNFSQVLSPREDDDAFTSRIRSEELFDFDDRGKGTGHSLNLVKVRCTRDSRRHLS